MAAESSFDFLDLNMLTTIAKTPGCCLAGLHASWSTKARSVTGNAIFATRVHSGSAVGNPKAYLLTPVLYIEFFCNC